MQELDRAEHTSRPWRIHALAGDFRVEDVWRLPMAGGPHDFDRCVDVLARLNPVSSGPRAVRTLFALRRVAGQMRKGDAGDRSAARNAELVDRLPDDLRATTAPTLFGGQDFPGVAVTPLYKTAAEWAVAIASTPVDGILHVGWTADEREHRGQLTVLTRRRGLVGHGYMALIAPARRFVVYPLIGRELQRRWRASTPSRC